MPRGPWSVYNADGVPGAILVPIEPWPVETVEADQAIATLLSVTGAGAPVYFEEAINAYRSDWHVSADKAMQALVVAALDVREMVVWAVTTKDPVFFLVVLRDTVGRPLGSPGRWE